LAYGVLLKEANLAQVEQDGRYSNGVVSLVLKPGSPGATISHNALEIAIHPTSN